MHPAPLPKSVALTLADFDLPSRGRLGVASCIEEN